MKLYNLLEDIILEERAKLITEGVSDQEVMDAINKKYNVNILYDDFPDSTPAVPPSKRYIQVYDFIETKSGNKTISAYQIFGGSKTTPKKGAWKLFRLDRIRGWFPTKMTFNAPVSDLPSYNKSEPKFNPTGNKVASRIISKIKFDK
jgi:hypothetical protein